MPKKSKPTVKSVKVDALKHKGAKRRYIPTAELESVVEESEKTPIQVAFERRNRDLDPQLVWRGKDEADWSDLVVPAPPVYIQEKVHPKALIDELIRESKARKKEAEPAAPDLFADFNGLPDKEAAAEFYQHDANWTNRLIVGDSLQVMASLAEREGLRGQVQCIYFDPPYGIKFNSNFQWSTTSRDVKDGNKDHISREPEQVRAFRDTWRDGIHSYLTYLRDRLTVARDLLADSGSIFVQIGDENVHRVRAVMDEVFGEDNFASLINFQSTSSLGTESLSAAGDYIVWYYKDRSRKKYRPLLRLKNERGGQEHYAYVRFSDGEMRRATAEELDAKNSIVFFPDNLISQRPLGAGDLKRFDWRGKAFSPNKGTFKTDAIGMQRLALSDRLYVTSGQVLRYVRLSKDYPAVALNSIWSDTGTGSFTESKVYVVQTNTKVIERCILMATDPGDLVLDPTCGSGTTAYVAEQWGRRWITIDTSRVAAALARSRIMGARYPYYLLADSAEGQRKEAEVTRSAPKETPTYGDIRQGFVYERVPHVTLKSIANNAEIDVIWEKWQATLEPARADFNKALGKNWEEWEIPREADAKWPAKAKDAHKAWWDARIARQREIDASIAAKADYEYLYDKPYADASRVRVAGPFTVESLSPHRVLAVDEDDSLFIDGENRRRRPEERGPDEPDFARVVLDHLQTAGVQQARKADKIVFTALTGWPGEFICAEGRYQEGNKERRAGIFIGPEFGTVSRADLVEAAREAGDARFDVLIACAFNYDAHSSEFEKLGRIPVLKARMHPDMHMAGDLKNTGAGNLFVVFGEPDIRIQPAADGQVTVKIEGVDIFHPQTGKIESADADDIALWMIDTDYNGESFFVRHAYFLGASDPYKALRTSLKAEIDEAAWASLKSDISRPFPKPKSGRIAVKVINHLGDEVMKVYPVK